MVLDEMIGSKGPTQTAPTAISVVGLLRGRGSVEA